MKRNESFSSLVSYVWAFLTESLSFLLYAKFFLKDKCGLHEKFNFVTLSLKFNEQVRKDEKARKIKSKYKNTGIPQIFFKHILAQKILTRKLAIYNFFIPAKGGGKICHILFLQQWGLCNAPRVARYVRKADIQTTLQQNECHEEVQWKMYVLSGDLHCT